MSSKSPELLARYCDLLLKKSAKNPEEAELEDTLNQVVRCRSISSSKDSIGRLIRSGWLIVDMETYVTTSWMITRHIDWLIDWLINGEENELKQKKWHMSSVSRVPIFLPTDDRLQVHRGQGRVPKVLQQDARQETRAAHVHLRRCRGEHDIQTESRSSRILGSFVSRGCLYLGRHWDVVASDSCELHSCIIAC